MTDQPTTCHICGARVDLIGDFWHTNKQYLVSQCPSIKCSIIFLEVEK